MIRIKVADIKFAFESDLNITCKDEMELFETSDMGSVDYIFRIEKSKLPLIPKEKPVFKNGKLSVYNLSDERLIYHSLPNHDWNFCLRETADDRTIYVIPENVNYLQNMWNVFDKIEFSSRLLDKRAVMLHSSYIIYDGMAILFSAASGVGKSTQAKLWKDTLGADIINGDRSIIREKDGRLYAFGTPFSGSSGICQNKSAPIRAIVSLEQGKENSVRKMTGRECISLFYAQTTIRRWNADDSSRVLDLWSEFMTRVPVLHLNCRPDEDAVYTLKKYLDALDTEGKQDEN